MRRALLVANLGGFASFLINDIKLLQSMGYQVFYAANANMLEWNDTKRKLESLDVPFCQIDFDSQNPINSQNLNAYKQLVKLLREYQFDFIHCHTPIAGLLTRLAARKYRCKGVRIIYTTHGFAFNSNSRKKTQIIYSLLEKLGSRYCDAMITINKEDFHNAKKMHCKNVYYINGVGVDTSLYRNIDIDRHEYRKSIGVNEEQIMVLSVGELSDRKNHMIIVDAIANLKEKEKYVYVVCGNGINGGVIDSIKQRAIEKRVNLKLLGFRFDIPEITYCSDIGAIPSKREGLGLAGIQSLAAGIPVVGSNVQGIKDYIIDGETGYLCDAMDAVGFAESIDKLANLNPKKRMEMSNKCIEMAKMFDKDISSNQMEKIYREILN